MVLKMLEGSKKKSAWLTVVTNLISLALRLAVSGGRNGSSNSTSTRYQNRDALRLFETVTLT